MWATVGYCVFKMIFVFHHHLCQIFRVIFVFMYKKVICYYYVRCNHRSFYNFINVGVYDFSIYSLERFDVK